MSTDYSAELEAARKTALEKLDKIEACLLTADPLLSIHCASIHKQLLEQDELIHILPFDKIKVLLAGMKTYKNIKLVAEAAKTRKKGKVTADDL